MGDLYVVKPGDSDEWRTRLAAENEKLAEIRQRWIKRVGDDVAIDVKTARQMDAPSSSANDTDNGALRSISHRMGTSPLG